MVPDKESVRCLWRANCDIILSDVAKVGPNFVVLLLRQHENKRISSRLYYMRFSTLVPQLPTSLTVLPLFIRIPTFSLYRFTTFHLRSYTFPTILLYLRVSLLDCTPRFGRPHRASRCFPKVARRILPTAILPSASPLFPSARPAVPRSGSLFPRATPGGGSVTSANTT